MEKVYEELDESKAEIEKLKADCRAKAELSEKLKKAHDEQLLKFQEVSLKNEKKTQDLSEKTEELSTVKHMYEDIKSSLKEKESIIKHLSSANEKLRTDCEEKSRKWEGENRELVLALEEANEKGRDEELKICAFKEELEGLKVLLSVSQQKCLEAEEKATASKKLTWRDDVLQNLEEQNQKVSDELKWKKEQFKHLEEAHEKLQDQFRAIKKEWEREKSNLLDEISSLQTSLDSQTRISQDLKSRLERCNQALAHEESRRKCVEVQLSESKACFENAFDECEEANSKMESLPLQRDNDIAALRNCLGTKEILFKEVEYQSRKLEQENQELRFSLKELQEAQIHQAGASSSVGKLRNKLKRLDQINRDCYANLKTKEDEWSSQLKKMEADFNECRSELNRKDAAMKELKMELENSKLVHRDCSANLKAKEAPWSSQLEKMTGDLHDCKCELEIKDKVIDELKMELENSKLMHRDCSANLKAKESLWSSQLEKMTGDLNDCKCELEIKDKVIDELKMELENSKLMHRDCSANLKAKESPWSSQLEKMTGDLNDCKCELEIKDKVINELKMELENSKLMHRDCSANLKAKEAQWSSQLEKMTGDLNDCKCELEIKDKVINELKMELEGCHSSIMQLKVQSEETSLMLSVYKTGFTEAQSMLENEKAEMDLIINERDEKVSLLMKQLEVGNIALSKAQRDIEEEREKAESLLRRIECFNVTEQQQLIMQKELQRHKEMLLESSECGQQLKERALQMECDFKERLREACDALDRANYEFLEKTSEVNEIEFEMQIWKSTAERLKVELEESQEMRKELEASLLSQVEVEEILRTEKDGLAQELEEKDRRMANLHQQVVSLNTREMETPSFERMETLMAFQSEKQSFLQTAEEKEKVLKDLQKEIERLEQHSLRRELESAMLTHIGAERTFEHEKENFIQLVNEKEQRIDDLLQHLKSLEQNFNSSLTTFSSQLEEKEAQINLVHEAWEKIAKAEVMAKLEVEEKKLMVFELEDDIANIQKKLELQEMSLSQSEQQALVIEAKLEAKQLELKKLSSQMETKLRTSDAWINELKSEKGTLLEDIIKLSAERENLLGDFGGLCDRINEFSGEDMQLMGTLEKIVQAFNISEDLKEDERLNYLKKNQNATLSPTLKKLEEAAIAGERSPFRELNN